MELLELLLNVYLEVLFLKMKRVPHNKMSHEAFVEKANLVHKGEYDYSKTKYVAAKYKVIITCRSHGDFYQNAGNHIAGQGCPECSKTKRSISRSINPEIWLERFRKAHGSRYDYSRSKIINGKKKIIVICEEHGEFLTTPSGHGKNKNPIGCPSCAGNVKHTLEEFITLANKKHKYKYDYSQSVYVNNRTKLKIICPVHGIFLQKPDGHLVGQGCKDCATEMIGLKKRTSQTEFIKRLKEVHGNKFNYSKVDYQGGKKKIIIICPEHGELKITAETHLYGAGCAKCAGNVKLSKEEFLTRCYEVHEDAYDYSKVDYQGANKKIIIICPEHGEFSQTPSHHTHRKQGCPKCSDERRVLGNTIYALQASGQKVDGAFYILQCYDNDELFYKVGVTRKSVSGRYFGDSLMPYEFEIILEIDIGVVEAYHLEQDILERYSNKKYLPKLYFGGHSECLSINPLEEDEKLKELNKLYS